MQTKNYELKRWYDIKPYTDEVLDILKNLSLQSHYDIAREVLKVIDVIKSNSRELDEPPLSLGVERVVGLFSQSYKRRWYDKNPNVHIAIESLRDLTEEQREVIIQNFTDKIYY